MGEFEELFLIHNARKIGDILLQEKSPATLDKSATILTSSVAATTIVAFETTALLMYDDESFVEIYFSKRLSLLREPFF